MIVLFCHKLQVPTALRAHTFALPMTSRFAALLLALALLVALFAFATRIAAQEPARGRETGLPLPRFASLKAEPVNLRSGPGTTYPIAWELRQAGMPLEILQEFGNWRQVRDAEGTTGWVHGQLLSGRRTAVIAPWAKQVDGGPQTLVTMYASASESARIVARFEPGGLINLSSCDRSWCRGRFGSFDGYLRQSDLWGVYQDERLN